MRCTANTFPFNLWNVQIMRRVLKIDAGGLFFLLLLQKTSVTSSLLSPSKLLHPLSSHPRLLLLLKLRPPLPSYPGLLLLELASATKTATASIATRVAASASDSIASTASTASSEHCATATVDLLLPPLLSDWLIENSETFWRILATAWWKIREEDKKGFSMSWRCTKHNHLGCAPFVLLKHFHKLQLVQNVLYECDDEACMRRKSEMMLLTIWELGT